MQHGIHFPNRGNSFNLVDRAADEHHLCNVDRASITLVGTDPINECAVCCVKMKFKIKSAQSRPKNFIAAIGAFMYILAPLLRERDIEKSSFYIWHVICSLFLSGETAAVRSRRTHVATKDPILPNVVVLHRAINTWYRATLYYRFYGMFDRLHHYYDALQTSLHQF